MDRSNFDLPSVPRAQTGNNINQASNSPIGGVAQNSYGSHPTPQESTPVPPPPARLKTSEIAIEDTGKSIKYFFISLAIATIIGSLVVVYLQSAKGAAANQREDKYTATIEPTINSAAFKAKEKSVQDIGTQVSSLQSSLASRVVYTPFFKELESTLYKGTRLTKVVVNSDSLATVEGATNTFSDLAKTVDALSASNKFDGVELISAEKQPSGVVSFVISIELNKNLLSAKSINSVTNK